MIYTKLTNLAMNIAYNAHHGQYDKSGMPYICHPIHIAEQVQTEEACVVALLHDVVEDTEYTIDMLREKGIPEECLEAIQLLTKPEDVHGEEAYLEYVRKLKGNRIARMVKIYDLRHNMDESRLPEEGLRTEKIKLRQEKYRKAIAILTKPIGE